MCVCVYMCVCVLICVRVYLYVHVCIYIRACPTPSSPIHLLGNLSSSRSSAAACVLVCLWLCGVCAAARRLPLRWCVASPCGGLSSCGALALGCRGFSVCGTWSLPGLGLEPVSPALAGGVLSTVPPGKSRVIVNK